jgi:hypothetical protein
VRAALPDTVPIVCVIRKVLTTSSAAALCTLTSTACRYRPPTPEARELLALMIGWVVYVGLSPYRFQVLACAYVSPGAHSPSAPMTFMPAHGTTASALFGPAGPFVLRSCGVE